MHSCLARSRTHAVVFDGSNHEPISQVLADLTAVLPSVLWPFQHSKKNIGKHMATRRTVVVDRCGTHPIRQSQSAVATVKYVRIRIHLDTRSKLATTARLKLASGCSYIALDCVVDDAFPGNRISAHTILHYPPPTSVIFALNSMKVISFVGVPLGTSCSPCSFQRSNGQGHGRGNAMMSPVGSKQDPP